MIKLRHPYTEVYTTLVYHNNHTSKIENRHERRLKNDDIKEQLRATIKMIIQYST